MKAQSQSSPSPVHPHQYEPWRGPTLRPPISGASQPVVGWDHTQSGGRIFGFPVLSTPRRAHSVRGASDCSQGVLFQLLWQKKKEYKLLIQGDKKDNTGQLWGNLTKFANDKNPPVFWKLVSGRTLGAKTSITSCLEYPCRLGGGGVTLVHGARLGDEVLSPTL